MLFFRSKAVKELDSIVNDVEQYLMNNYKDPAHESRKKLGKRTQELFSERKIDEKTYRKYMLKYSKFTNTMRDYHH